MRKSQCGEMLTFFAPKVLVNGSTFTLTDLTLKNLKVQMIKKEVEMNKVYRCLVFSGCILFGGGGEGGADMRHITQKCLTHSTFSG